MATQQASKALDLGGLIEDKLGSIIDATAYNILGESPDEFIAGFLTDFVGAEDLDIAAAQNPEEFVGALNVLDINAAADAAIDEGLQGAFGAIPSTALNTQIDALKRSSTAATAEAYSSQENQELIAASLQNAQTTQTNAADLVERAADFTVTQDLVKVGLALDRDQTALMVQGNAIATQNQTLQAQSNSTLTNIDAKLEQLVAADQKGTKDFTRNATAGVANGSFLTLGSSN